MMLKRFFTSFGVAVVLTFACTPGAEGQSCNADLNGDGVVDGADLAAVLAGWGVCPPVVNAVSPTHGSISGGTVITITGSNLLTTTSVQLGGVPCTEVQVLSPTQVRAVTPAASIGSVPVVVTSAGGSAEGPQQFNYVLQAITSISPASGTFQGGTLITISGQFLAGTTGVRIGGVPATNVQVVSANVVSAVTPPGPVGPADVVLTGSKGTVSLTSGYSYVAVVTPSWATLIEEYPDPSVVTSESLRAAIVASGYAWRVRDTLTQIEMVLIPAGSFTMGCTPSMQGGCLPRESPVHPVTISQPFYLGRYEVTQSQWQARLGANPSFFQGSAYPDAPNQPVESVSWTMAQAFLNVTQMRLPTEAEWEFAYRAGTTTAFHGFAGFTAGTNDDTLLPNIAWFIGNANYRPHPVGQKLANGFGIYDMAGNVWEWVSDWYNENYYASSPIVDPSGAASGTTRVLRGGSWNPSSYCRASFRSFAPPTSNENAHGFRIARNP